MIRIGIIGAAGYTGGELIRILSQHPNAQITYAHSRSQADRPISSVHPDLFSLQMNFASEVHFNLDYLFLCTGHGRAKTFMEKHEVPSSLKIIDLSHDYRMDGQHEFIYGLPELNRDQIQEANRVANPGCFATAIQLAMLPAASTGWLDEEVHVHAITGSTGAGQNPSSTGHFSWRNNNVSVYKAFAHQHLNEINQSIKKVAPLFRSLIHFVPVRGNFTRGIFASLYWKTDLSELEYLEAYQDYYDSHPFVYISKENPDLKQVINTNHCILYIKKHGDMIHLISMVDNLIKGASGQAVQNMNLMQGFPETSGLMLKSSVY